MTAILHRGTIPPPNDDALWAMYDRARDRAKLARGLLVERLARGVAPVIATTSGEPWPEAAKDRADIAKLIDAYCRADKGLEDAARTIVDCLDIASDRVEFALPMVRR